MGTNEAIFVSGVVLRNWQLVRQVWFSFFSHCLIHIINIFLCYSIEIEIQLYFMYLWAFYVCVNDRRIWLRNCIKINRASNRSVKGEKLKKHRIRLCKLCLSVTLFSVHWRVYILKFEPTSKIVTTYNIYYSHYYLHVLLS